MRKLTNSQDGPDGDLSRAVRVSCISARSQARRQFLYAGAGDQLLAEQAHPLWKEYANYFMLHGAVHRNLYHAGQIALLNKQVC